MKKRAMLIRIALISAAAMALQPAFADGDSDGLEQVRAKVSSMFEEIKPEHIQPSPIDGWYTVRKGAIVAYVSGDGRYLLQGDLIDLEMQVNLSEAERNKARVELVAGIPAEQRITFAPDEVKYSITVFTDIDCTYCRKLHSQIDDYLAQGIEVNYLLYPRNGPTSQSWIKAENVWCADDRNEALTLPKSTRILKLAIAVHRWSASTTQWDVTSASQARRPSSCQMAPWFQATCLQSHLQRDWQYSKSCLWLKTRNSQLIERFFPAGGAFAQRRSRGIPLTLRHRFANSLIKAYHVLTAAYYSVS